jgi:hypothetical protein
MTCLAFNPVPVFSGAVNWSGRVSTLRRIIPARAFDRQIRKLNRLAG